MRVSLVFAGAALAFTLSAAPASSAVRSFDLDQISKTTIAPLHTTLGIVTLTDILGGVDVKVSLLDGTKFVNTGGPHTGFAFNLNTTPSSISIVSPNTRHVGGNHPVDVTLFVLQAGSQSATPYGSFSNGFDCIGCGPGGSHAFGGPFEFQVFGVNISNFVSNSDKYFFAADVLGPNGGTGSISSGVPEPSTWALMLAGFAGLLAFGRRKHRPRAA